MKALRDSRGIALLFSVTSPLDGFGEGQSHAPAASNPGKSPVPIVQEAGCAPGTVWTTAENLAPNGIRSPDRPARSQSLYRLSYPVHLKHMPKVYRVDFGQTQINMVNTQTFILSYKVLGLAIPSLFEILKYLQIEIDFAPIYNCGRQVLVFQFPWVKSFIPHV